MGSLERRLGRLEAQAADASSEWVVPVAVRVLTKAVARHRALEDGREPSPYSQEEVEEMRRDDLGIVADSGGVGGEFRESVGWQSKDARELLAGWERDARRRVEATAGLPPHRWGEVYGQDEELRDE